MFPCLNSPVPCTVGNLFFDRVMPLDGQGTLFCMNTAVIVKTYIQKQMWWFTLPLKAKVAIGRLDAAADAHGFCDWSLDMTRPTVAALCSQVSSSPARQAQYYQESVTVCCCDWLSELGANMSADLAASHPSSEFEESDLYEPAASTLGSRYKRVVRSKSCIAAGDWHPNTDLKVVKKEVKPQPPGRSGLLAAQLKGYAVLACTALLQRCCPKS